MAKFNRVVCKQCNALIGTIVSKRSSFTYLPGVDVSTATYEHDNITSIVISGYSKYIYCNDCIANKRYPAKSTIMDPDELNLVLQSNDM